MLPGHHLEVQDAATWRTAILHPRLQKNKGHEIDGFQPMETQNEQTDRKHDDCEMVYFPIPPEGLRTFGTLYHAIVIHLSIGIIYDPIFAFSFLGLC